MFVLINEIRVYEAPTTIQRVAFNAEGRSYTNERRLNVANVNFPRGVTLADVAPHYAAIAPFTGGSVCVPSATAPEIWGALCAIKDQNGTSKYHCENAHLRAFAVILEDGTRYALTVQDGDLALTPAERDDAAIAAWQAEMTAERTSVEGSAEAAELYSECVKTALEDPAVMAPLFDGALPVAYAVAEVRERFSKADYVQTALASILGGIR